jgi:hypothetical protein
VFISYSHDDQARYDELRGALERKNVEVLAPIELPVGAGLHGAIQGLIERADAIVVLVSRSWLRSQWGLLELGAIWAQQEDKGTPVLPVLIDRDAEIPSVLRDRVYADASRSSNVFETLAQQLSENLDLPFAAGLDLDRASEAVQRASRLLEVERADFELRRREVESEFRVRLLTGWLLSATVIVATATLIALIFRDGSPAVLGGSALSVVITGAVAYLVAVLRLNRRRDEQDGTGIHDVNR